MSEINLVQTFGELALFDFLMELGCVEVFGKLDATAVSPRLCGPTEGRPSGEGRGLGSPGESVRYSIGLRDVEIYRPVVLLDGLDEPVIADTRRTLAVGVRIRTSVTVSRSEPRAVVRRFLPNSVHFFDEM